MWACYYRNRERLSKHYRNAPRYITHLQRMTDQSQRDRLLIRFSPYRGPEWCGYYWVAAGSQLRTYIASRNPSNVRFYHTKTTAIGPWSGDVDQLAISFWLALSFCGSSLSQQRPPTKYCRNLCATFWLILFNIYNFTNIHTRRITSVLDGGNERLARRE